MRRSRSIFNVGSENFRTPSKLSEINIYMQVLSLVTNKFNYNKSLKENDHRIVFKLREREMENIITALQTETNILYLEIVTLKLSQVLLLLYYIPEDHVIPK